MDLSIEQVNAICNHIEINDIINYINSHILEYEEFLNKTKKGK